jgi:DNA-binding NtrC family response regulator
MAKTQQRILILDANVTRLSSSAGSFRRRGLAVHTAQSGREALETLSTERFDVVLVDGECLGSALAIFLEAAATLQPGALRAVATVSPDVDAIDRMLAAGAVVVDQPAVAAVVLAMAVGEHGHTPALAAPRRSRWSAQPAGA